MPNRCARGCGKRVCYKGCVCKPCSVKHSCPTDPRGKHKALNQKWNPITNAKWNPINNPINNPFYNPIYKAKAKRKCAEENEAYILKKPKLAKLMMDDDHVQEAAWEIYTSLMPELKNLSPQVVLRTGAYSIYTGTTKRTLEEEGFRWLEERGANNGAPGQRNRPVLRSKNTGKVVSTNERKEIGFQCKFIFRSTLRYNCNKIEDRLQTLIGNEVLEGTDQKVPLGLRLHCHIAMSSNKEDPDRDDPAYLCGVFFTFAPYEKIKQKCNVIR